ncbi:proline--tRNA ligase [Candidatus Woesearchaeota archaeon]|nr:proline--tRNA ligase [Candidatus Woesearchaeota archaeon]
MAKKKAEEKKQAGITVNKEDNMPDWYSEVIQKAELADPAVIQGFMVIRPNAYVLWEGIQKFFDARIKEMDVRNAYFPLLIPESFFKKEAEHAEGFAPELAWIEQEKGEERLALRPTSETIMYDSYSKWIRSYRDLPLRINQWSNTIRWEVKQTKIFLRTREFLWQEGHCVYETAEECDDETKKYLIEYQKVCEELLAIPAMPGCKSSKEKFAGADRTYSVESLMPDGKAIQMGTSHFLGQGFAKSFGIKFLGKDEKEHTPWQNSWGISTRMLGALIMMHSDNKGLVIPPRLAYNKLVIVPIIFDKTKEKVLKKAKEISVQLKDFNPILDDRDEYTPRWKYNDWELKGIPLRIEIGPKDLEKNQVMVARRDNGKKEAVPLKDLKKKIPAMLEAVQKSLFDNAKKFLKDNTVETENWKDIEKAIKNKKLVKTIWCEEEECEDWMKDKTGGAKILNMPFKQPNLKGKKCPQCGKPAKKQIYFAKSY